MIDVSPVMGSGLECTITWLLCIWKEVGRDVGFNNFVKSVMFLDLLLINIGCHG